MKMMIAATTLLLLQFFIPTSDASAQASDCRVSGCSEGYICRPFMAGKYTCSSDHDQKTFSAMGTICHVNDQASSLEAAKLKASTKAQQICLSMDSSAKAIRVSEFKQRYYFPGQSWGEPSFCAEATAQFKCNKE